ncbi:hypothetical protein ACFP73_17075 [Tatumella punctata]|uniref:Uncharacterized protein n=1 Tax=Tatumella punctata TaxID=399969 RepID=A0ABW1VSS7_9GAMM
MSAISRNMPACRRPDNLYGQRALSGLVMGYHLVTVGGARALVLPVYDNRPVQPENHGL